MLTPLVNKFRTWKPEHRAMKVAFPSVVALQSDRLISSSRTDKIVAFHTTDSIYEHEAKRMTASARRFDLEVVTTPITGTGDWVRNASMKAGFLAEQRRIHSGPLLYVDVDAVFHRDPWPYLDSIEADVAVYYEESGRLLAGTIWIGATPAAQNLLDEWKLRCNTNPYIWDQLVLEEIIAEDAVNISHKYRIALLPVSFCWIFDKLDNVDVNEVFVEHLQASRETKKKIKLFGCVSKSLRRRRERIAEIERILF